MIPVPDGPKPLPTPPNIPVGVVEPNGVVLVGVLLIGFTDEGVVDDGVVVGVVVVPAVLALDGKAQPV